jgi:hypothetical protein
MLHRLPLWLHCADPLDLLTVTGLARPTSAPGGGRVVRQIVMGKPLGPIGDVVQLVLHATMPVVHQVYLWN